MIDGWLKNNKGRTKFSLVDQKFFINLPVDFFFGYLLIHGISAKIKIMNAKKIPTQLLNIVQSFICGSALEYMKLIIIKIIKI